MKKIMAIFLAVVLVLGVSGTALAKPNPMLVDGRNGNSEKNGSFDLILCEGPYFVGETVIVAVENLVIDGPLDTLVLTAGAIALRDTPGEQTISVTATTYFKNGQKSGIIHTQITQAVTITVLPKPTGTLPVATSISSAWNGHPNQNNTVRVNYEIAIDGQALTGHANFNHHEREAGEKIVEKDGYEFVVLYLAP